MSIARLRALTHLSFSLFTPFFVCRNEYRPIKGIDTKYVVTSRSHYLRRNEYRPIKGIDTKGRLTVR